MSKYQIYEDTAGEFRWNLKASNGRIVASGEGYTRWADAMRGVLTHQRCATRAKLPVLKPKARRA